MPYNSENNKRIAKNTFFLTGRTVITMLVYLYTSRVILNSLGVEDYGVYNVVGGFVAMFGFLNSSLANGIQRFYNYERGRNGEDSMVVVYNLALRIQTILAITVVVLLEAVGVWYVGHKMVVPDGRVNVALWLFQFSTISMFISIIQVPYLAAIMSCEKMDYYAIVSIIDVFVNLGIAIILPFLPVDKLFMYGLLVLGRVILMFLMYFIYCKRIFSFIRFSPSAKNPKMMKEMLTFSGWNVFGTFGGMAKDQGLNVILNLFFGPVVNAARGVANQVSGAINSLISNVGVSVRPQLTGSYAQGDKQRSFNLMFSLTKISVITLYMLSLPIMVEIDYILHLWLGDVVPEHTAAFVVISFLTSYISSINAAFSAIFHSSGKMKYYQLLGSFFNILILPIDYMLLKGGCTPETALWMSFAIFGIAQIPNLLLLRKQEGLSIRNYIREVVFPIAIVMGSTFYIPLLVYKIMASGIIRLFTIGIISVVTVAASFYFLGANPREKAMVRNMMNGIIARFKSN